MENQNKRSSKGKVLAIIGGVVVIVAIAAFAFFNMQTSKLSDLRNKTLADAKKIIVKDGFKVGEVTKKTSEKIKDGRVISTEPKQDEKIKKGSKIDIVVSTGAKKVAVGDFTNTNFDATEKKLTKLGYTVKTSLAYSATVPNGSIISQDLDPDTKVNPEKTTITFIVSKGEQPAASSSAASSANQKMVTVPSYAGKSILQLAMFLSSNDLTYNANFVSNSAPISTIISNQTGTFPVGTVIQVTVSNGQ